MYIFGLIPQNFAELAEAVPIGVSTCDFGTIHICISHSSSMNVQLLSGTRDAIICLGLCRLAVCVYVSSQGSGAIAL